MTARPAWRERAACRGTDGARWFAETARARAWCLAVCAACPVREECYAQAMAEERYSSGRRSGVRGGALPAERQAVETAARAAARS